MAAKENAYRLTLMGSFRLTAPDGRRLELRSKKAIALLGLLATAQTGERSRTWIQDKLWSTRELGQAQTSLRRELHNLRKLTEDTGVELIQSDSRVLRLNLDNVAVDLRNDFPAEGGVELLEGLDLAGEESFEEWLREARHGAIGKGDPALVPPGDVQPSSLAAARDRTTALVIMPLQVVGHTKGSFCSLPSDVAHLLVKCLGTRKWLPILMPPKLISEGDKADRDEDDPDRQNGRYVLAGQLLIGASSAQLVLDLKVRPGSRLLWTETTQLPYSLPESELHEIIGRVCNDIVLELFYAETRRIQGIAPDVLNPADLTHLVRHYLGQLSTDHFELARKYLDRAMAAGHCTSEQVILDAYLKTLSYMGSDYPEIETGKLRAWASTAITADPTDWRGSLLASMIELWLGNPTLALSQAQFSNELSPFNGAVQGQLGCAYTWCEKPELAIKHLELALSLSLPERRPYVILCNLALCHLMQDRLGQALATCDQAASCVPELGLAYVLKIEILVRLGRVEEAARVYTESLRPVFDDVIAVIRKQKVLPEPWIERVQRSLDVAIKAAAGSLKSGLGVSIAVLLWCLYPVHNCANTPALLC